MDALPPVPLLTTPRLRLVPQAGAGPRAPCWVLQRHDDGAVVGHAGLRGPDAVGGTAELHGGPLPGHEGQGLMAEALQALAAHARAAWGVDVLVVESPAPDARTRRWLARAGFVPALGGRWVRLAALDAAPAGPAPARPPGFSLVDGAAPDLLARIDDGLGDANARAAPLDAVRPLACVVQDAHGALRGGAVGRTWGRCAELQQLWVDEGARRQGLGAALVRRFESLAAQRGCRQVYLETFSFQAPRLYRALGYVPLAAIDGFAPGVVKLLMARRLDASPRGDG